MARNDTPTFVHGDFVRFHTAGPADAHKVLGQETDKQGREKLILWDYLTASSWTGPVEKFVRIEAPAVRLAEAA